MGPSLFSRCAVTCVCTHAIYAECQRMLSLGGGIAGQKGTSIRLYVAVLMHFSPQWFLERLIDFLQPWANGLWDQYCQVQSQLKSRHSFGCTHPWVWTHNYHQGIALHCRWSIYKLGRPSNFQTKVNLFFHYRQQVNIIGRLTQQCILCKVDDVHSVFVCIDSVCICGCVSIDQWCECV